MDESYFVGKSLMSYLLPIILCSFRSKIFEGKKISREEKLTKSIPPGIVFLKTLLAHWVSVQFICWQKCAEGVVCSNRPPMVSFNSFQRFNFGYSESPGWVRQREKEDESP